MIPILEAVPNFSEGRDLDVVRALADAIAAHPGVEVLDWTADPDHNRSVITYVGDPGSVEEASLSAARLALENIDLRSHEGVHPRIGALDVLPFVPLRGLTMDDAAASARRVGRRLVGLGIPVFYYGRASQPPGRGLAELRRGGFEALREGFPADRVPDEQPAGATAPHPTAGATCVGARPVLLAWNVFVEGISLEDARRVAESIRERGGGFPGVRALGLHLERRGRLQISMNLEDPARTSPLEVLRAVEEEVGRRGGRAAGVEVVGMIPDTLVHRAAADRLDLLDPDPSRILSLRVSEYAERRWSEGARALRKALEAAGDGVPAPVRDAALRLIGVPGDTITSDEEP